jgi:FixJ family two-component response regulator
MNEQRSHAMMKRASRVFVVGDDRSVRTGLANLLESDDYTVETFASAADLLGKAALPWSGLSRP